MNNEQSTSQEVVAWARPVYARPVSTLETDEWDELVDIEFHLRAEKPEGEGWYPLVVADTGGISPIPRINVKGETVDNGIAGSTFLRVLRVEREDDGGLTAVVDHRPRPAAEGEEIMVNTPYDVFTLPLQPSGLSSGPRFVVHVPGPEQPATVDGEDAQAAEIEALRTRERQVNQH